MCRDSRDVLEKGVISRAISLEPMQLRATRSTDIDSSGAARSLQSRDFPPPAFLVAHQLNTLLATRSRPLLLSDAVGDLLSSLSFCLG